MEASLIPFPKTHECISVEKMHSRLSKQWHIITDNQFGCFTGNVNLFPVSQECPEEITHFKYYGAAQGKLSLTDWFYVFD